MSVDIWCIGLSTKKWPGYLKTKMLKIAYENLTFLNIVSISTRDLFFQVWIGSYDKYISFGLNKSSRSAFDGERYHSNEWKSHKWMKSFVENVLSLSLPAQLPRPISTRHIDFGTRKELTSLLYNLTRVICQWDSCEQG